MVQFACHTWGFADLSLPEALGTIARLGFRYVDIGTGPHLSPVKAAADPQRLAAQLTADLRVHNLQLNDLTLWLPGISHRSAARRKREVERFSGMLPFLRLMAVPGVTLSSGLIEFPESEDDALDAAAERAVSDDDESDFLSDSPLSDTLYSRSRDSLREMVALAEGLPLRIQPQMDSVVEDAESALRLLDDVPGLGLTLDWGYLVCAGTPKKHYAELVQRARHVTVRQAAKNKFQLPFEKGRVDLDDLMRRLIEAGYEGVVSMALTQQVGWHNAAAVDSVVEAAALRDALRDSRERYIVQPLE